MGVFWRTFIGVYLGLQDSTLPFASAKHHTQNLSDVARFVIVVGLHLLPRNELLLCVGSGSSDEVSEYVTILDLRPTSHVRTKSIIWRVRVATNRVAGNNPGVCKWWRQGHGEIRTWYVIPGMLAPGLLMEGKGTRLGRGKPVLVSILARLLGFHSITLELSIFMKITIFRTQWLLQPQSVTRGILSCLLQ